MHIIYKIIVPTMHTKTASAKSPQEVECQHAALCSHGKGKFETPLGRNKEHHRMQIAPCCVDLLKIHSTNKLIRGSTKQAHQGNINVVCQTIKFYFFDNGCLQDACCTVVCGNVN
jgi:hypothetical protein